MEYFPMFRAVREANKRNEGEARAHSAAAYERAILLCHASRTIFIVHDAPFRVTLASEWLRNVLQKHALPLRNIIDKFYKSNGIERFEAQCRRIAQNTLFERHVFAC